MIKKDADVNHAGLLIFKDGSDTGVTVKVQFLGLCVSVFFYRKATLLLPGFTMTNNKS